VPRGGGRRVGLSARGHQLVEKILLYDDHLEAGVLEGLGVRGFLVQQVDTTLLRGLFGGAHTGEIVGPVAAVRGREVYVVGPDQVSIGDLRVVEEGVDDGQVPAASLDENHVPHAAPVVQYRGVRRRVIGYGFDLLASPVDAAHVDLRVGPGYAEQR